MSASDQGLRANVLDPRRSFIVQAPAGSGKTELLIQRYLTLLGGVREPEQVVAITFTRKAAAEMRARILAALGEAADGRGSSEAHRKRTLELARDVIAHDTARGWSLLDQPHRLRIDTLDALNFWLAQQLPLLAAGVAGANVAEDAQVHYRHASRRTVDQVADPGALGGALSTLLMLCENSVARLERLLAAVLPMRDQWLRYIAGFDAVELQHRIDAALESLVDDRIEWIRGQLGDDDYTALTALLRHVAEHATPVLPWLQSWLGVDPGKTGTSSKLAAWRGASQLLLTATGQWRKRFTKRQGFGPTHKALATERERLLEKLRGIDGFREALVELADLPEPGLTETQRSVLAALQCVLTHLLAELSVSFRQAQTVDFTELALAAQEALGAVDQPSDLLLALDQRIEHILVDEFQDTSRLQFRLLELLTGGWSEGDGRTLFLVGDPMQSIYRFRDADMSLFLQAQQHGVGAVTCESVILKDNFRSAPALVDWVNGCFNELFGGNERLSPGAVRYNPCNPARQKAPRQFVELHAVDAAENNEHRQVIEILERELRDDPDQSIGILVQSRSHLAGLRAQLRSKGWPVHAIEIDSLADDLVGQDLLGLTRALMHFGDRIAWLAILRAPWCGATWDDLNALCADDDDASVWELIRDPTKLAKLSDDGQSRIGWLAARLELGFSVRGAHTLARWVECCWQLLDGPACLPERHDLVQAELFFRALDTFASRGDIDDPAQLESAFSQPIGQGDPPREAGIEIMTIHRAKGLEFDAVVLFGVGREVREPEARALYWHEWTDRAQAKHLIMGPMARRDDALQDYLRSVERDLDWAERARLLYVAMTRARDRLHLVTGVNLERETAKRGSLVNWLWPQFGDTFVALARSTTATPPVPADDTNPPLRRVAAIEETPRNPLFAAGNARRSQIERPEFEWVGPTAVHVGTLVHRELQRMGQHGVDDLPQVAARAADYRKTLALFGVPAQELEAAVDRVEGALRHVLSDSIGRWILQPHTEAESELRLTVLDDGQLRHLQIDRTFVDDEGVRWIIDYKVSEHRGGDRESFLAAEVERYRDQLHAYAHTMARIDPRPIRVGLYFPLLTVLRDWEPSVYREPVSSKSRSPS